MQAKARKSRAKAAVSATPAKVPVGRREVVEGQVIEMLTDGRARMRTLEGRTVECRLAAAIDAGWLRAALAFGPVEAEGSVGANGGSIWAVFPGAEHEKALTDRLNLAASQGIDLSCGKSTVTLTEDGRVRVRGRDVAARGTWVARLQGRTVRIN
jgi:hypothetical protein